MADADGAVDVNFLNENKQDIFGDNASKIKLFSVILDDIVTDFAVCEYIDRVLIIITQFQKIGSLISVTKGTVKNLCGLEEIYDIKTISGLDSEQYQLAARYLASHLEFNKPILFGISLKSHEPKILKALAKVILENI